MARPEVLPLYPKAFAVLCCLLTQAGQLVTKETLLADGLARDGGE